MGSVVENLLNLAIFPFKDYSLFVLCAGFLCVAQLFRIVRWLSTL